MNGINWIKILNESGFKVLKTENYLAGTEYCDNIYFKWNSHGYWELGYEDLPITAFFTAK